MALEDSVDNNLVHIFTYTKKLHTIRKAKTLHFITYLIFYSVDKWADVTLDRAYHFEKYDTYRQIVEAGFDIKAQAEWLEAFYKEVLET